jgi:hypothetical protein
MGASFVIRLNDEAIIELLMTMASSWVRRLMGPPLLSEAFGKRGAVATPLIAAQNKMSGRSPL